MADLWVACACIILVIGYSATGYYLHKVMSQHFTGANALDRSNYDKGRNNVSKSIRILGLYPVAYFFQWLAYGLLKTGTIALTYENVLWVVTTANTGGMLNFFIYYPLLLNQVRRKWGQRTSGRASLNPSAGGSNHGSRGNSPRAASSSGRKSKELVPQKSVEMPVKVGDTDFGSFGSSGQTTPAVADDDATPVQVTLDTNLGSRSASDA